MKVLKFISISMIISSITFPAILSNIANDIDELLDKDLTYILYDADFYAVVNDPYNYFEYELYYGENGIYDIGEEFVDIPNGKYNEGEVFTDRNRNKKWDKGERFIDIPNGTWNPGEKFTDKEQWAITYEVKNRYGSSTATQSLLNYIESAVNCNPYLSTTYSTTDVKIEKIDDKIYRLYTNCKYPGIGLIIEKNTLKNKFKPSYPANLSIDNIKFTVSGKERRIIYANEEARLDFDIINNGKGSANLTKIAVYDIESAIGCVIYNEYIVSLPGDGARHHISVPIKTINSDIKENQLNIEDETLNLYIHAFEYNGFDANPKWISIKYKDEPTCDLKIKAIQIDDDKEGNSWGDDNGIINKGEAIEVSLYIINDGETLAKDIEAIVSPSDNKRKIFINNLESSKKNLAPGTIMKLSFDLITTKRTGYSSLIELDLNHSNFNVLGNKNTKFDLKFNLDKNLNFPFKIITDTYSLKFIEKINGVYDQGEIFIDVIGNGKWDEGEEFVDTNWEDWDNMNKYTEAELNRSKVYQSKSWSIDDSINEAAWEAAKSIKLEGDKSSKFITFDEAPEAISGIRPKYPTLARASGIEGTVVVEFFINKKGIVTEVVIISGTGTVLDEAAVNAVKASTWKPARQRTEKVGVWIKQPLKFYLK